MFQSQITGNQPLKLKYSLLKYTFINPMDTSACCEWLSKSRGNGTGLTSYFKYLSYAWTENDFSYQHEAMLIHFGNDIVHNWLLWLINELLTIENHLFLNQIIENQSLKLKYTLLKYTLLQPREPECLPWMVF